MYHSRNEEITPKNVAPKVSNINLSLLVYDNFLRLNCLNAGLGGVIRGGRLDILGIRLDILDGLSLTLNSVLSLL